MISLLCHFQVDVFMFAVDDRFKMKHNGRDRITRAEVATQAEMLIKLCVFIHGLPLNNLVGIHVDVCMYVGTYVCTYVHMYILGPN